MRTNRIVTWTDIAYKYGHFSNIHSIISFARESAAKDKAKQPKHEQLNALALQKPKCQFHVKNWVKPKWVLWKNVRCYVKKRIYHIAQESIEKWMKGTKRDAVMMWS